MMNDENKWDVSKPRPWEVKTGGLINSENKIVYLTVVWMLGIITIISLIGMIGLCYFGKEIPQAFIALSAAAVAALGSLFTHSK